MNATNQWLDTLATHQVRMTGCLQTIIAVLSESDCALNAETLWDKVRERRPATGRATVYRAVEKLESFGLIERVHGVRGCSTFIPVQDTHQALFICRKCGWVGMLEGLQPDIEGLRLLTMQGFTVSQSRIQVFGMCKSCQETSS
jgi:Fur family ferric uptake transcriptional regulator